MSETLTPKMIPTDQGKLMMARAVAQEKLEFTRMAMGDGQIANLGSIPSMTALIHERVSVAIDKSERTGNVITVSGPVHIPDNSADFRWRELGLFGKIGNESEQLLAVTYKGESGEMVSPADGEERTIYVSIPVDAAANVTVTLAPREMVDWDQITNPPATYPPSAHGHPWSEIADKPTAFPPESHSHPWSGITSKPTTFPPESHSHPWSSITGKPGMYTPADHSHNWEDINNPPATYPPSGHSHSWDGILGKPTVFPPSSHNHGMECYCFCSDTFTLNAQYSVSTIRTFQTVSGNIDLNDYHLLVVEITLTPSGVSFGINVCISNAYRTESATSRYDYQGVQMVQGSPRKIVKLLWQDGMGNWLISRDLGTGTFGTYVATDPNKIIIDRNNIRNTLDVTYRATGFRLI